ncbi:MAG: hypothetical protein OEN00_17690, partial [Gemmatimonadota bacterium]|nr:hypothetical protein [Gemmatimonadota bacterium]
MSKRLFSTPFLSLLAVGCAAGSSALQYGVPTTSEVRYAYADTSAVEVNVMGQNLEMTQRGIAEYAVSFAPAADGVNVTMSVIDLDATLSQPMGAPVRVDESDVEGALVFKLDRFGNSVVAERPRVEVTASQMVSGLALAHSFFPGLSGRAAEVGD